MRSLSVMLGLFFAAALVGCGGKITVGDGCTRIAEAACAQVVQCGSTVDQAACVADSKSRCCGNAGTCDKEEARGSGGIDACVTALKARTCDQVTAGTAPSECQ
ncbi:MAG: hypothetical protein IT371_28820 [Deltaproteobacteria bacterium]|nr:hypothetical protein [Deltaproteobacteria bacterium]